MTQKSLGEASVFRKLVFIELILFSDISAFNCSPNSHPSIHTGYSCFALWKNNGIKGSTDLKAGGGDG